MTADITQLVQNHIAKMSEDGTIEKIVTDKVTAAIEASIGDAFGSWSPFRKAIEAGIKETVKVDLKDLGIPGYNDLVRKILTERLAAFFEQKALTGIQEEMDRLLADFPQTVTVSKLAEMFRNHVEEHEHDRTDSGNFTFRIKRSDHTDGWFDIYLDPEDGKEWYSCKYKLRCNPEGIWSCQIDGDDTRKKLFMGPFYDFERFVFHAYTNKVIIEVDTEDPETYYGYQD